MVTGVTLPVWQTIGHFFTAGFPAAVYRARYWWITVGVINIAVAVADRLAGGQHAGTGRVAAHRRTRSSSWSTTTSPNYYTENPAADFAFQVWLNNAEVTAICLVLGIAIVPVLVLLWFNIANVGVIGGFMVDAGRADVFYGLLLPHGLLELTIIFVAAGAGLRLGWSWIAPGQRTRSQALATEGRAVGALALGLAVWLLRLRTGRGLRHAVDAAGRGAAGHRRHGLAGLPGLRVHPRPPGGASRRDRGRGRGAGGAGTDRSGLTSAPTRLLPSRLRP